MTAIVGVICSDGVVVGSDSAASFGFGNSRTIEQRAKKVEVIGDRVIIAGTGQVGLNQRFCHLVKKLNEDKELAESKNGAKKDHIAIGKLLSQKGAEDFGFTQATKGQYGCVVAFPLGKTFHLLELQVSDFQPEFKTPELPFVTLGCGQPITDPFLGFLKKVFFAKGLPNLQEGKFITMWALLHAIDLNPGGINGPVQLAVLKQVEGGMKANLLEDDELQEQAAAVDAAEKHLRGYSTSFGSGAPAPSPSPTPPLGPKA